MDNVQKTNNGSQNYLWKSLKSSTKYVFYVSRNVYVYDVCNKE
jgi:hypothetical protein